MTTLSKEEREDIVQEAVERVLLSIPEVVGNLIANHTSNMEINKKFYKKHSEFKDHKDAVMSVVEMMEGKHPHVGYEKLLEKSVPEIRKRIKEVSKLNIDTVSNNPDTKFKEIKSAKVDINPHGEL